MPSERTDFVTGVEVPDPYGTIIRAGNEYRIGWIGQGGMVLQAHDTVGMALELCQLM